MPPSNLETTYHDVLERYLRDPVFQQAVNLLTHFTLQHKLTPGELRDAAFCASLRVEMFTIRGFGRGPDNAAE